MSKHLIPMLITAKDLRLLRQAVRIATEDGSLLEFGTEREVDALAKLLSTPQVAFDPEPKP